MKLRNTLSKELFFSFSLHLTSRSCIFICRQFWAFCVGVAENSFYWHTLIVEVEPTTLPLNAGIWLATDAASFPRRTKFVIRVVACIRVNMVVPVFWRQPVFCFTGSFVESGLTNVFLTECVGQCDDTCKRIRVWGIWALLFFASIYSTGP